MLLQKVMSIMIKFMTKRTKVNYTNERLEGQRQLLGIMAGEWEDMVNEAIDRARGAGNMWEWWLERFLEEVFAGRDWRQR